jgi:hypothetical protein
MTEASESDRKRDAPVELLDHRLGHGGSSRQRGRIGGQHAVGAADRFERVLVDRHQEPFVVVLTLLVELLTEPVLPNPEVSEELVELDVPVPLTVEVATVPVWLDAYASARWSPSPPAVSVVASRTPAVERRVVDRARLARRLVMRGALPTTPRAVL